MVFLVRVKGGTRLFELRRELTGNEPPYYLSGRLIDATTRCLNSVPADLGNKGHRLRG